jgi:hypothetical protein
LIRHLEDAPREQKGAFWSGRVYGFGPVEGDGRVQEYRWYFRARGDAWGFEVRTDRGRKSDVVEGELVWQTGGSFGAPRSYDASWMSVSAAWSLIVSSLEAFRELRRR